MSTESEMVRVGKIERALTVLLSSTDGRIRDRNNAIKEMQIRIEATREEIVRMEDARAVVYQALSDIRELLEEARKDAEDA